MILFFSSMLFTANVNAQLTPPCRIGVLVGDQAEYLVEAQAGWYPSVGSRIRFEVTDINVETLYNKDNSVALTFQYASWTAYIDGVSQGYQLSMPTFYPLTPPFFPTGSEFWHALSHYDPTLNVTIWVDAVMIQAGSFTHFAVEVENETHEYLSSEYVIVTVGVSTGLVQRYQWNYEYMSLDTGSNTSYSYSAMVLLSLVGATAHPAVTPEVSLYLFILLLVVPGILVTAMYAGKVVTGGYATKARRAKAGGKAKERILSELGDEELLALAKTVHGAEVTKRTSRTVLVKMIKESLSIEQIERQGREGAIRH